MRTQKQLVALVIPLVQPLPDQEVRLEAPLVRVVADRHAVKHNQRQAGAGRRDQALPGGRVTPLPTSARIESTACNHAAMYKPSS